MRPLIILLLAVAFIGLGGGLPLIPQIPVVPGVLVATAVSGWALLRRGRQHAQLAFPALAVAATLLTVGPIDVSVRRHAALGVRVVPVQYGLPTPDAFERGSAGDLDLRGCIVPMFPKSYTVRIGLNPLA
jgi:hypothetical protein